MSTNRYVTRLSIPLLGLAQAVLLREVHAALDADERVERVTEKPEHVARGQSAQHVTLGVYIRADSDEAAKRTAADLRDIALRPVLAALPSGSQTGWTSSYSEPEPSRETDEALPGR